MLFIHSNNTKISSHGLINNLTVYLELPKESHQQHNMLFEHSNNISTYKQHIQSTVSFGTVQNHSRDFATQSKIWNRMNGHFSPQTSLTIKMALSQRLNQVKENPYLSEFFETPQYWYPRVALAVGINFTSCLAGSHRSDCRKI